MRKGLSSKTIELVEETRIHTVSSLKIVPVYKVSKQNTKRYLYNIITYYIL